MRPILMLLALGTLAGCAEPELAATDAWVRQPPPGAPSAAGYLTLTNDLHRAVTLTGASASGFGHTMVHETVVEDGVSTMRHATPLEIGPGETVEFAPGGLHLMLMHADAPLQPGQHVDIELVFAAHHSLTVSAPVRAPQ